MSEMFRPDIMERQKEKESVKEPILVVPSEFGNEYNAKMREIFAGNRSLKPQLDAKVDFEKWMLQYFLQKGIAITSAEQVGDEQEGNFFHLRNTNIENQYSFLKKQAPEVLQPVQNSWQEYLEKTFLPALVSFEGQSGGKNKFLIEDENQLKIFKKLLLKYPQIANLFRMKEYVECPSDHYTSYRVAITSTGTILGSALLYSNKQKIDNERQISKLDLMRPSQLYDPTFLLTYSQSEFFLNSKKVVSNLAAGGNYINLEGDQSLTDEQMEILIQHQINMNFDSRLPSKLVENSQKIASTLGKATAPFLGIDFIQDKNDNFYYLESNINPDLRFIIKDSQSKIYGIEAYKMASKIFAEDLVKIGKNRGKVPNFRES